MKQNKSHKINAILKALEGDLEPIKKLHILRPPQVVYLEDGQYSDIRGNPVKIDPLSPTVVIHRKDIPPEYAHQ